MPRLKVVPADLPFGAGFARGRGGGLPLHRDGRRGVQAGQAQGICTAPLSKEALHAAGHKFPGHTELLAHLTGTPEVSMMLVSPKLRVIHVTTHIGLIDAIAKIEPGLVERVIARGHGLLVKAGIANPKIGVCAINPHAGENGLFGRGEEAEKIAPAIAAAQAKGWDVRGPLPADTLFFLAGRAGSITTWWWPCTTTGPRPDQGPGTGGGGEHHRGPAGDPHLRRPRHRLRTSPAGASPTSAA